MPRYGVSQKVAPAVKVNGLVLPLHSWLPHAKAAALANELNPPPANAYKPRLGALAGFAAGERSTSSVSHAGGTLPCRTRTDGAGSETLTRSVVTCRRT